MDLMSQIIRITDILSKGLMREVVVDSEYAYLRDKVSGLDRTRVTAEFCTSLINLQKWSNNDHSSLIRKLSQWIISKQNADGSWNEVHSSYDKPSSVFTSICALSLLDVQDSNCGVEIPEAILANAARYLVDQEIAPGYFRKSEYYHADILNADAMISAYLTRLGTKTSNVDFIKAGKRALANICAQQFIDGAYPYGGPMRAYPYKYHLNVPCIHYQTVTLYYLQRSAEYVKSDWLEHSINVGKRWLMRNQANDGHFAWKNSGLNFALYLTATYSLAVPIYLQIGGEPEERMAVRSLEILEQQIVNGILLRWERGNIGTIVKGAIQSINGGFIGDYPLSYKILRSGHRIFREIARAKISKGITMSKLANRAAGYSAFLSTTESSTNYTDIYMTTEALEALSRVGVMTQ